VHVHFHNMGPCRCHFVSPLALISTILCTRNDSVMPSSVQTISMFTVNSASSITCIVVLVRRGLPYMDLVIAVQNTRHRTMDGMIGSSNWWNSRCLSQNQSLRLLAPSNSFWQIAVPQQERNVPIFLTQSTIIQSQICIPF
jgi:hypothetical protein